MSDLLDRAVATRRCFVYDAGQPLFGSRTPLEAALGSDVAVHGHLYAGTAGLEAALAGVPTLLVDREGWTCSSLYQLGVGKVVFTDWETLWERLEEGRNRPGGVPGFGDWSPMLDDLDPFRDGRAAERMGTYLQWLLSGLREGKNRETVLAEVADRYSRQWGVDKIQQVNCGTRSTWSMYQATPQTKPRGSQGWQDPA